MARANHSKILLAQSRLIAARAKGEAKRLADCFAQLEAGESSAFAMLLEQSERMATIAKEQARITAELYAQIETSSLGSEKQKGNIIVIDFNGRRR
jgi:hypothetical protein